MIGTIWSARTIGTFEGSPVFHAFRQGHPAAIAGFVVPVVVDAVKNKTTRWFAHVGVEVFEGEPSLADRNTTAAIVPEIVGSRVGTTLKHRGPSNVTGSPLPASSLSMGRTGAAAFNSGTAARFGSIAEKISLLCHGFIATIATAARGDALCVRSRDDFKDCQLIEFLPDHGRAF